MERVQFQQEQMLAELKDLVEKGLFSQEEVRQIMKKRTVFETSLVRRIPKKSDFLRYAAYEMNLEALRSKRANRLKVPRTPATISDYSLLRRQFQIFERALRKFKDDVSLWIQYIQAAERAQARSLVSKVCGRALQMHPNCPQLYIMAASHELNQQSHSAARVLLQRGIRMNSDNVDLWTEYVKMELGFAELLRRRWAVLGLHKEETDRVVGQDDEQQGLDIDQALPEDEEDEGVRREILNGALVREVINNAVKSIPSADLFQSIDTILKSFPAPKQVRHSLLAHMHTLLHGTLQTKSKLTTPGERRDRAKRARIYASRALLPELEGEAMVDALRRCNEDLAASVRSQKTEEICEEYSNFIEGWFGQSLDEHFNIYLLTFLRSLASTVSSPSLCATNIRLLRSSSNSQPPSPEKLLKLARKYISKYPTDEKLWIMRLEVEAESEGAVGDADWRKAKQEAIENYRRSNIVEAPEGVRRWEPSSSDEGLEVR